MNIHFIHAGLERGPELLSLYLNVIKDDENLNEKSFSKW